MNYLCLEIDSDYVNIENIRARLLWTDTTVRRRNGLYKIYIETSPEDIEPIPKKLKGKVVSRALSGNYRDSIQRRATH